jgi:monoamine oxidase
LGGQQQLMTITRRQFIGRVAQAGGYGARSPYSLGSWVSRGPDYPPAGEADYYGGPYRELIVPDDRTYFAGDHCSHIIGWQEGAALAAQRAITMIVSRISQS